jgi:hypothetical protein
VNWLKNIVPFCITEANYMREWHGKGGEHHVINRFLHGESIGWTHDVNDRAIEGALRVAGIAYECAGDPHQSFLIKLQ